MSKTSTRSTRRMRVLAVLQAVLILVSLGVPVSTMAAITSVTPDNLNQGASGSITIASSTGNNFPNSGSPYAVSFSGTGVTAAIVVRQNATQLTAVVTVTAGATPGLRTLTVTGAGGFVAQEATFTVNAAKVNSTTSITSHTPDPSIPGAAVSVAVSIVAASGSTSPTGSVTVSDGTVTSAPCALSGSGGTATATCSLTPTTAGAKTLTATYGGDATFNASSGTTSHTVLDNQAPLFLTGTTSPAVYGTTQALGTTGGSGTGAVSYTSTTPAVCTISGGNTLTMVAGTGTCSVYATKAADANYSAAISATVDIAAAKAAQAPLVLSGTSSPAAYYDTQALGTSGGSGTGAVSYSTGGSTACSTAGATLTVTASTGNCAVSATKAADENYLAGNSATANITVGKAGLVVTPDPQAVAFGDPVPVHTFAVTGFRNGENAGTAAGYIAPSCTSGYTISTPIGSSPLLISCSGGAATNYTFDTSATAMLTIGASAQAPLFLTGTTSPAVYGTTQALGTTGGSGTGAVSYTSTTPAVCTISGGNTLTMVAGTGTCSVYATKAADANYSAAISATVDIAAAKASATCAITGASVVYDGAPHGATGSCTGVAGETLAGLDLGASFTDVPGGTAAWTFTDVTGNYADASGSADITIAKADTATVVSCGVGPFTYTGSAQAPCSASVTGPGGLDSVLTVAYLDNTNAGTATAGADYPGDANRNTSAHSATFQIGPADAACVVTGFSGTYDGSAHGASGVCTGVNDETLTGLSLGASFTNVPGGSASWSLSNGNYNPASGSVDIEITPADADCSVSGFSGSYDGDAHGATGSCSGVDDEALLGLDLGASFTNVPGGTADWTFSNGNYHPDSGSVDIEISPVGQTIVFPPIPDATLGSPRFELQATTESGLPITYRSLTPAVCTVSGTMVTVVATGTCSIEASQAGDANHAPAEPVTRSFSVAASDTSTPETSTASPVDLLGGPGPLPPALLLGLMAVGLLAAVLVLLGLRARRDGFAAIDEGR